MISSNKNSFFLLLFFFLLGTSCANNKTKTDQDLAKTYCGACHAFPEASQLDKSSWRDNVLPAMSGRMGIRLYFGEAYEQPNMSGGSYISAEDWKKIAAYYEREAPATMPLQNRPMISGYTSLFDVRSPTPNGKLYPSSTFIKIDPGNSWIYTASAFDSTLLIFNSELKLLSHARIGGILVDIDFATPLIKKGSRSGTLTDIGLINPNDLRTGSCDSFQITEEGKLTYSREIFDSLSRPVQISVSDFNNDQLNDYLVCGFGNQRGSLTWMQQLPGGKFKEHILLPLPGAIKAYIEDYNHDGLPDIWVLMAQAKEAIYLFTNKGGGNFKEKMTLEFPAVYGSSYFEFADFNGDGKKDILYTCGDNADYTSNKLKNFHGLYIFLNHGNNEFEKAFFFPIHGCYKAIARDFDLDGDLDIASISFFPDQINQPQEGFVYLENNGDLNFQASTIKEFGEGKWITMDVGDIDGDGDQDIVLGSLAPQGYMNTGLKEDKYKALFLLLKNKTR